MVSCGWGRIFSSPHVIHVWASREGKYCQLGVREDIFESSIIIWASREGKYLSGYWTNTVSYARVHFWKICTSPATCIFSRNEQVRMTQCEFNNVIIIFHGNVTNNLWIWRFCRGCCAIFDVFLEIDRAILGKTPNTVEYCTIVSPLFLVEYQSGRIIMSIMGEARYFRVLTLYEQAVRGSIVSHG